MKDLFFSKLKRHLKDGSIFGIMWNMVASYIGKVLGYISRVWAPNYQSFGSVLANAYYTARWKVKFKYFGKGSRISYGVEILNPQDISVGSNTSFSQNCMIESWHYPYLKKSGEIFIGNNCNFGEYTHVTSTNKIQIGDNLLTGRFVLITDNTHGTTDGNDLDFNPVNRKVVSKGPTIIGENVWLGDKVAIMPGVTIGNSAIIAANSVVTHDIPAFALAAGVPAKIIKKMK